MGRVKSGLNLVLLSVRASVINVRILAATTAACLVAMPDDIRLPDDAKVIADADVAALVARAGQ
jgi:hypothetical protein